MTGARLHGMLLQAGPRGTTAPPAVTESLVAASRATSSLAADYENMKAESLLWSLVLVALCSAATTYFYSQVPVSRQQRQHENCSVYPNVLSDILC